MQEVSRQRAGGSARRLRLEGGRDGSQAENDVGSIGDGCAAASGGVANRIAGRGAGACVAAPPVVRCVDRGSHRLNRYSGRLSAMRAGVAGDAAVLDVERTGVRHKDTSAAIGAGSGSVVAGDRNLADREAGVVRRGAAGSLENYCSASVAAVSRNYRLLVDIGRCCRSRAGRPVPQVHMETAAIGGSIVTGRISRNSAAMNGDDASGETVLKIYFYCPTLNTRGVTRELAVGHGHGFLCALQHKGPAAPVGGLVAGESRPANGGVAELGQKSAAAVNIGAAGTPG